MTSSPEAELRRLLDIMEALRHPETGCPWDREQDFATIAPYTIEEAYEVADAIARHDFADLPDELGDLLFQVVYHARMAEEAGRFGFADVARAISDKMIRRHPHVFGDAAARDIGFDAPSRDVGFDAPSRDVGFDAPSRDVGFDAPSRDVGFDAPSRDAEAQTQAWEVQKSRERAGRAETGTLSGIPVALPALTRALKISRRAARVGFDWPDPEAVLAKLDEEIGELRAELPEAAPARLADELGDLLFVVVNLARKLDLDPEECLRQANTKFMRRFGGVEAILAAEGRVPADATLAEMEAAWQAVKKTEI